MFKNPLIQQTIKENNMTLRNAKILSDILANVEQTETILPDKKIDIFDNGESLNTQFYNDLSAKLADYLDAGDIVKVMATEFEGGWGDVISKELILNWDLYESIFENLRGRQLSLARLVDRILDATKKNINKKKDPTQQITKTYINQTTVPTQTDTINAIAVGEPIEDEKDSKSKDEGESISGKKEDFDKQQPFGEELNEAEKENFINLLDLYYNDNGPERKQTVAERFKILLGKDSPDRIDTIINDFKNNKLTLNRKQYNAIQEYNDKYATGFKRNDMLEKLKAIEWTDIKQIEDTITGFNNTDNKTLLDKYIKDGDDKINFIGKDKNILLEYISDINEEDRTKTNPAKRKMTGIGGEKDLVKAKSNIDKKFVKFSNITLCLFLFFLQPENIEGKGIKIKQVKGKGISKLSKAYHKPIHKFYIDNNRLNNGILEIRYISNKHLSDIQPIIMKPQFKKCFGQLMNHGQLDMKDYQLLNASDKELIRKIVKMFNLDIQIDDNSDFATNFEILKGQYRAGNDSKELKEKLKEYILYAVNTNMITRNTGKNLMVEIGMY